MKKPFIPLLSFILFACSLSSMADSKNVPPSINENSSDIKMLSTFLFTSHGDMADGNRVVFAPQYSNGVDGNDAIKLTNPGENFGLLRDGRMLAVEARQLITAGDSLFYNMSNLIPQSYNLMIVPENLAPTGISCILIDKYMHTQVTVSLRDTNRFVFQVTADLQSKASDRLLVVFKSLSNSDGPVRFTDIAAADNGNAVNLTWKVEEETEVDHYDIERSTDNKYFQMVHSTSPVFKTAAGGIYQYKDVDFVESDNYYRVKSISKTGSIIYSQVAKILVNRLQTALNVYPNPVVNSSLQIDWAGSNITTYRIRIMNYSGLVIFTKNIRSASGKLKDRLILDRNLSKGNYTLSVSGDDGSIITKKLVIQ